MENWTFQNKKQFLKFENFKFKTTKTILEHQMTSNENLINIKVLGLIKIYNLDFGVLVIWLNLYLSKFEF
jgi:hypothetical protein